MIRSALFVGILLAAITIVTDAAAYSCTKPTSGPSGPTCSCQGYFDCKRLEDSGKCDGDIGVCDKTDGGKDECTCKWKARLLQTPLRLAPQLEMKSN